MTQILGVSITKLALASSQLALAGRTPKRSFNRESHRITVFTQIRKPGVRIPQTPLGNKNIWGLSEAVNTSDLLIISLRSYNGISQSQGFTAGYICESPEGDSLIGRAQTFSVWCSRFESWSPYTWEYTRIGISADDNISGDLEILDKDHMEVRSLLFPQIHPNKVDFLFHEG